MGELYILAAVAALAVVAIVKVTQNIIFYSKQLANRDQFAGLDNGTEDNTCKSPHQWDKIQLAMNQLPVALYDVCTECGLVGGTAYKLNKAAMDIYQRNLEVRALQKAKQARREQLSLEALDEVTKAMQSEGIEPETAKYFLGMYKDRLWAAAVTTTTEFPGVD